jgi:hypothetical protein
LNNSSGKIAARKAIVDLTNEEDDECVAMFNKTGGLSKNKNSMSGFRSPERPITENRKQSGEYINGIKKSIDHNINHNKHFMSLSLQTKLA